MILSQNDFTKFINEAIASNALEDFFINYYQSINKEQWQHLGKKFINSSRNYFYCSSPVNKFSFLAFDELISFTEHNFKEFNGIRKAFNSLKPKIVSNAGDYNLRHDPFFFGTVKFPSEIKDKTWIDFSDSKWFVPKFLLLQENSRYYIVINSLFYRGIENYLYRILDDLATEDPAFNQTDVVTYKISEQDLTTWAKKINLALKNISDGTVEKIVLSRYCDLELSGRPNIKTMIDKLEEKFPGCYTFAYRSDKSIFFGSTPEKLFSLNNSLLQTDALAGSIRRGDSEESDSTLQQQLLHDKKNLAEHNAVIKFLKEQLSPFAEEISIEDEPVIRKLSNIQHLYTPITAKIKEDVSIFSILEKIHPTPAVCGIPPQTSKRLITEIENFERGLYAGALGWLGLNDTAEMFVGIRSAVLNENRLRAFAGGGIVEGSNSADEYNETILKLSPILSLFANETIGKP